MTPRKIFTGFRVADLDLQTRALKVDLPSRIPRSSEVAFRIKFRRPEWGSALEMYWLGVKIFTVRCSDGADLVAHAAHILNSLDRGLQPYTRESGEIGFRIKYSGDPDYPCELGVYWDGIKWEQLAWVDGVSAIAQVEVYLLGASGALLSGPIPRPGHRSRRPS
jgi:hypothetical protein